MDGVVTKSRGADGSVVFVQEKTMCCGGQVEWSRGLKPAACPHCGDPYFDKPGLEYRLFQLQDEFLADFGKTGSTRILGEKMFPIIVEYAENLIKMLLKGKALISYDELSIKANDSATQLIEVIMRDPERRMRVSFGGYLKRLCKNAAYKDKNNDQTYSMQYIIGDDTEFGSTISRKETHMGEDGDRVEETVTLDNRYDHPYEPKDDPCEELCNLIGKTAAIVKGQGGIEKSLLYLIGLRNKLASRGEQGDRAMNGFYEIAGNEVRDFVEKGEYFLYLHLRGKNKA